MVLFGEGGLLVGTSLRRGSLSLFVVPCLGFGWTLGLGGLFPPMLTSPLKWTFSCGSTHNSGSFCAHVGWCFSVAVLALLTVRLSR